MEINFPHNQLELVLSMDKNIRTLEFSVYDSRRNSPNSTRKVFRVSVSDLQNWWSKATNGLSQFEEIGLNSRVILLGYDEPLHVPMIDLKGADKRSLLQVGEFIRHECQEIRDIEWFSSGRSFHGYGMKLLDEQRWRYFMGTLLLYRSAGSSVDIDTRWVGHRLRDGYSCLRLTWNSTKYVGEPKRIQETPVLLRHVEFACRNNRGQTTV
jgi:hypothetical protein